MGAQQSPISKLEAIYEDTSVDVYELLKELVESSSFANTEEAAEYLLRENEASLAAQCF